MFKVAVEKLDQQVCESVNKLNSVRHQRKNKEKKLERIQREVEQMSKETEEIQKTDVGESPDAQVSSMICTNSEILSLFGQYMDVLQAQIHRKVIPEPQMGIKLAT